MEQNIIIVDPNNARIEELDENQVITLAKSKHRSHSNGFVFFRSEKNVLPDSLLDDGQDDVLRIQEAEKGAYQLTPFNEPSLPKRKRGNKDKRKLQKKARRANRKQH